MESKKLAFHIIIPALIIQLAGIFTADTIREPEVVFWANMAHLTGTVMLIVGLGFYSKAKGRNLFWSFLAVLSIVGFIILFFLKNLAEEVENN